MSREAVLYIRPVIVDVLKEMGLDPSWIEKPDWEFIDFLDEELRRYLRPVGGITCPEMIAEFDYMMKHEPERLKEILKRIIEKWKTVKEVVKKRKVEVKE